MSIPLDAREILSHLNQLGYRNITPEQLKEFLKDLRKLIKFDTRIGNVAPDPELTRQAALQMNTFQRLHSLTTISYNAKIARKSTSASKGPPAEKVARAETPRSLHADPEPPVATDEKENQPAVSGKTTTKKHHKDKEVDPASKMWIRPRSTSALGYRKNDPVSLYHAYQKEWTKFRKQLPGENNHSDLRWQVRTKLLAEK